MAYSISFKLWSAERNNNFSFQERKKGGLMKRPKKLTRRIKRQKYKTPAGYKESKRQRAGKQLNQELNKGD